MDTPQMDAPQDTQPRSTYRISSTAALIALGLAIVIGAGLYFGGLNQGRGDLAAQKTQYEQQIKAGKTALDQRQAELAGVRNHNHMMQARIDLYRTAIDLDERNFGIANQRLREVTDALDQIKTADGGIDTAKVAALAKSIASSNINVATNLQQQRARILDFAARLDAIAASTP